MKIPIIKGIIDRRILINYQIDKEVLKNYLPKPFKPKLINGKGIAGICLIRLKEIRPKGLPKQIGISIWLCVVRDFEIPYFQFSTNFVKC